MTFIKKQFFLLFSLLFSVSIQYAFQNPNKIFGIDPLPENFNINEYISSHYPNNETIDVTGEEEMALLVAIDAEDTAEIGNLIGNNPQLLTTDWEEEDNVFTPLTYAIKEGKVESIKKLIELGADVDTPIYGSLPIIFTADIAGHEKRKEVLQLLLSRSANPVDSLFSFFYTFVEMDQIEITEDLVAVIHEQINTVFQWNGAEYTLLSLAIELDKEDAIELLLEYNADITTTVNSLNYMEIAQLHNSYEAQVILAKYFPRCMRLDYRALKELIQKYDLVLKHLRAIKEGTFDQYDSEGFSEANPEDIEYKEFLIEEKQDFEEKITFLLKDNPTILNYVRSPYIDESKGVTKTETSYSLNQIKSTITQEKTILQLVLDTRNPELLQFICSNSCLVSETLNTYFNALDYVGMKEYHELIEILLEAQVPVSDYFMEHYFNKIDNQELQEKLITAPKVDCIAYDIARHETSFQNLFTDTQNPVYQALITHIKHNDFGATKELLENLSPEHNHLLTLVEQNITIQLMERGYVKRQYFTCPLIEAIDNENLEIIQLLLDELSKRNLPLNQVLSTELDPKFSYSPLEHAVEKRNANAVELFLKADKSLFTDAIKDKITRTSLSYLLNTYNLVPSLKRKRSEEELQILSSPVIESSIKRSKK